MTPRRTTLCRLVVAAGLGASLALASGCASTAGSPSLFVLNAGPGAPDSAPRPGAPTLTIAPVSTASYLNDGGIVYQTGPHRVVIANDNRWASSLSSQLTDDLYTVLRRRLSGVNVVRTGGGPQGRYRLQTHVDQFLGRYDGKAHIAGRWTLVGPDGATLAGRAFNQAVPLKTDGYPALVKSLSRGWQTVGRSVASTLAGVLRPAPPGS
ncbi:PqiC family protein [Salinisphaera sp.]|uniref:PqiC family protein n=1 Tax=Salinisphaera sp. TaxID=1914330 RepID=UPI002D784A2C|nr:ABC-type transport auxiliary lipoprotein family protein [Salinisphaera sp.]HET7312920.1 ABC-type transport auxiliary lipoprotein family protein [Salinisphaera sp.]